MIDKDLLRFNDVQKIVIFDVETCSLNCAVENLPWELGFLVCQGNNILEKHSYFIKWPNLNISKDAARITRFDSVKYEKEAKDPAGVLELFESYLYDPQYIKMGHNIYNFDFYVHNIWRKTLGKKTDYSYIKDSLDTNGLAKMVKLGINQPIPREEWPVWMFKMAQFRKKGMKTNLEALGREFEIEFDYENSLHQGLQDVILNFKVWNRLKYLVEI